MMPGPGKMMTPTGMIESISSLRRKGAALACFVQLGLKEICVTLRASAQQAAMRSAPFGEPPGRELLKPTPLHVGNEMPLGKLTPQLLNRGGGIPQIASDRREWKGTA